MPRTTENPGASYHAPSGKWFARIKVDGERRSLGYFDTPEAASAAYMEARGEKAKAKRQRALEGAGGAGEGRRKAEAVVGSVAPGELALELLDALLPPELLLDSLPGQPVAYRALADVPWLAEMARVSRRANVSLRTVGELALCLTGLEEDAEAVLGAMVATLRAAGLEGRAGAVADLVTGAGGGLTFGAAVARVSGVEDMV